MISDSDKAIKAAQEAYATHGQMGRLRACPPDAGTVKAMLDAAEFAVRRGLDNAEIETLRTELKRSTDSLAALIAEVSDPGVEALAALHTGCAALEQITSRWNAALAGAMKLNDRISKRRSASRLRRSPISQCEPF